MKKRNKRCRVSISVIEFFTALDGEGNHGFAVEFDATEQEGSVFERKNSRPRYGNDVFFINSAKISIRGCAQASGKAILEGDLNNNHKKRCRLIFSLRTGKGFIWAKF